jgi:acyl carrier protein
MRGMTSRILAVLERAGMSPLPKSAEESLEAYGVDSLMMVMIVTELEVEFGIKVPSSRVDEALFKNIATLSAFAQSLGAK